MKDTVRQEDRKFRLCPLNKKKFTQALYIYWQKFAINREYYTFCQFHLEMIK